MRSRALAWFCEAKKRIGGVRPGLLIVLLVLAKEMPVRVIGAFHFAESRVRQRVVVAESSNARQLARHLVDERAGRFGRVAEHVLHSCTHLCFHERVCLCCGAALERASAARQSMQIKWRAQLTFDRAGDEQRCVDFQIFESMLQCVAFDNSPKVLLFGRLEKLLLLKELLFDG